VTSEWHRLLRYGAVGLLNTAVGYGVIALAMVAGLSPEAANPVGYGCGLLCSFILNSRFTFADRARDRGQALRFGLSFILAYGLNFAALHLAIEASVEKFVAQALAMVVYQVSFFLMMRLFVFATPAEAR
jgi:putative flippase GtrA